MGSVKFHFKPAVASTLILCGFGFFVFSPGIFRPLLILSALLLTAGALYPRIPRIPRPIFLLPFASGLLIPVMKLFYVNPDDWARRLNHLLLLALVFSLGLIVVQSGFFRPLLVRFNRLSLRKRLGLIFTISLLFFILASVIMVQKGIKPSGDEPHYLVITQSLTRDLDLNVFNQYARQEYRDFLDYRLRSHARVGKGFKKWYSFHLPGLSFTLSPLFLFPMPPPVLYLLVRCYMGIFGALLAVLTYLFSLRLIKDPSKALAATLVFMMTVPVFFMSIHIYPEIQVLSLLLSSLYLLLFSKNPGPRTFVAAGFLLGITIFWGLKYAIFIYLYSAGITVCFLHKKQIRKALWFLIFPLFFQLLFFGYLYRAYGNLSPGSIYQGIGDKTRQNTYLDTLIHKIPLKNRVETLLDYFLDQRDGLLPYSPFYIFALPGLLIALRKIRVYKKHLLLSLPPLAYLLYHGFTTIRAGYCPQGRYLVPVIPVLLLFAFLYYRESRNQLCRRLFSILPLYSLLVVVYQVLHPPTLYQPTTHGITTRAGLMFQQWSNSVIHLPGLLPSFVKIPGNSGYLPNLIFPILMVLFTVFALQKSEYSRTEGIWVTLFLAVFSLICLFPLSG